MEGVQPVASLSRSSAPTRAASSLDWLRERLTTTPGKLMLVSILVLAGAVAFGVIATTAERSRAQAAQAARAQTEPLLLDAATVYTALSDASATVTTTFLQGGLEPARRRAQYLVDLRFASEALTRLTRGAADSAAARTAVATIAAQLPMYSGLIEDARANNRQGFPVGAAYLRTASALLTGTILAEADHLYAIEAQRLNGDYSSGTSTAAFVVLVVVVVLAVALLVLAQHNLTRVSRRIFNLPMVASTLLLAAASVWALVGLSSERGSLQSARHDSDAVEVLSASRVLLSQAQSDQSLTLVNRGSDSAHPRDLAAVLTALSPPRGLLSEAASAVNQQSGRREASVLLADFSAYRAHMARISQLIDQGNIRVAISLASSSQAAVTDDAPVRDLVTQTTAAQRRFGVDAASATGSLSGLAVAIPVLTVVAAALALIGLRQRLGEYR